MRERSFGVSLYVNPCALRACFIAVARRPNAPGPLIASYFAANALSCAFCVRNGCVAPVSLTGSKRRPSSFSVEALGGYLGPYFIGAHGGGDWTPPPLILGLEIQ